MCGWGGDLFLIITVPVELLREGSVVDSDTRVVPVPVVTLTEPACTVSASFLERLRGPAHVMFGYDHIVSPVVYLRNYKPVSAGMSPAGLGVDSVELPSITFGSSTSPWLASI